MNDWNADPVTHHIMFPILFYRLSEQGRVRRKRQTLQEMARPLKKWMEEHLDNPYPNKGQKQSLAQASSMTLVQVSFRKTGISFYPYKRKNNKEKKKQK